MARTKLAGVRLDERECAQLDDVVRALAGRNPDLRPTRSDALRFLVASSVSVLGQMAVTQASPPPELAPGMVWPARPAPLNEGRLPETGTAPKDRQRRP